MQNNPHTCSPRSGLFDDPNRFAGVAHLELGSVGRFHGYQNFVLSASHVEVAPQDGKLRAKQAMVRRLFRREWLEGKSVLDLGANSAFFCFSGLLSGAGRATAVDIDDTHIDMVTRARDEFGYSALDVVRANVVDYTQPADLVLAFALIHWIYSCTATFGSLDSAVGKLRELTRQALVVEWVEPSDPAINFFHHLDWNPDAVTGSYDRESFESALRKHFECVEVLGQISPTRVLYAAYTDAAHRPADEKCASLAQLFAELEENNIRYVVLQDSEAMRPAVEEKPPSKFGILVSREDAARLDELWQTDRPWPEHRPAQRRVYVTGQDGREDYVLFDVRSPGDGYFPEDFAHRLIESRVRHENTYVPPPKEYFLSLLYHVVFHEGVMSWPYARKLCRLSQISRIPYSVEQVMDLGAACRILREHGVGEAQPSDESACPVMPFLHHPEQVIHSKLLAEHNGRQYMSRVYLVEQDGKTICRKQATHGLVDREHAVLRMLDSDHFPKALDLSEGDTSSACGLEFIEGYSLQDVKRFTSETPAKAARAFFGQCLDMLEILRQHGITHRDIRLDNIIVRNGRPVLMDFGWAVRDDMPQDTPEGLGCEGRPPEGTFCDIYAMGVALKALCSTYPELARLTEAMTRPRRADRVTDIAMLRHMLDMQEPEARKRQHGLALQDDRDSAGSDRLVSIVILVLNNLDLTRQCVESIRRSTTTPYELIVVDNGSDDGTPGYLASLRKRFRKTPQCKAVKVIRHERNLGYAAGNNSGIAAADGDYVLLLNNDVVVTPGWLHGLVRCAERDPAVGIVGPVTNCIAGPQQIEGVSYDTASLDGLREFADYWTRAHSGEAQTIGRAVGFCALVKRAVIDKIGGLDVRYGIGNFEDDDFCIRAATAGFGCAVARDVFVHHFGSRTFANSPIDYREHILRNWEIFKQKWGLPSELAYGGALDITDLQKQPFDRDRHWCPVDACAASALSKNLGTESGAPATAVPGQETLAQQEKPAQQPISAKEVAIERPSISLCVIARNEEAFIEECLSSAADLADEIVLLDTGSTDRTRDIARARGAAVHSYDWTDSYADARNEAMRRAKGDWILFLDADERLDPASKSMVTEAASRPSADAYRFVVHNYTSDGPNPDMVLHRTCRLHRNHPGYEYRGRVHEHVEPSVIEVGGSVGELDAIVHHYGYKPEIVKERRKHERYLRLLHAEVEEHPDNLYYLVHLARAYCAGEDFGSSIPYFQRAVEIVPAGHEFAQDAHIGLANALTTTGKSPEALDVLDRADRLGIRHPEIHFCRGNALLLTGQYRQAIEEFRSAMQMGRSGSWLGDPTTFGYKAEYGIASACMMLKDHANAAEHAERVAAEKPDYIDAHSLLANAYAKLGQHEKSEQHWRKVIELRPEDQAARTQLAALYEQLGQVHAEQDRLAEALQCYCQAVDADPAYASAYFSAGDVLYEAGKYEEAAGVYQNGLSHAPQHAPGFFTLGNCCFQLGSYEAAAIAYQQALALSPNYSEAQNNLALAEEAMARQKVA